MLEIPGIVMRLAALAVVAAATITDLRSRKIPNKLTFPAAAVGILMHTIYFATWANADDIFLYMLAGFLSGISGWIFGVFVMSFIKLFLRQMGHGDTKLVAAVGTFVGPWLLILVLMFYFLSFGFFTMFRLLSAVSWWQLLGGVQLQNLNMDEFNKRRKETIPVAPFIALGTLVAVILENPLLEIWKLD